MVAVPNGKVWEAIRRAGFTQRSFAQVVGMHEANVSKVVTGRLNLDHAQQARWAKVLKRKPEELFGDEKGCAA